MVVALRAPTAAEIAGLPRGDALHPEHGTRLIAAVAGLAVAGPSEAGLSESALSESALSEAGLLDAGLAVADGDVPGDRLSGAEGPETVLTLSGPGVPGTRRLRVAGLHRDVFAALAAANAAFPAGIDTFLVARDGTVAGLPRSTRIEIENGEH
ncbi:phosphonate C-P lyase system protein PhnH [Nonomuraea antimicrobica]